MGLEKIKIPIFTALLLFTASCNRQAKPEKIYIEKISCQIPENITLRKALSELEKKMIQMNLKNVTDQIPEIIVDLKYSTTENFLGIDVYGDLVDAYLQGECVEMLQMAFEILQKELPGYTFIIYDAARPLSVQKIMWEVLDVPEHQKFWYVAPPERGSIHNYGMAVDLTIADENGKPLDMGTEFDYFGELSFPRYTQKFLDKGKLTPEQADNRMLLISIMERAGFNVARTEWWHFNATSLANAKERYEIIE